ncbi:hypothetical protein BH23VER1_BH23VER1_10920 [soil metagenome]
MNPFPAATLASIAFASLASFASLTALQAQVPLLDWDSTWAYMHPTAGTLPAGSGTTTPHPTGTTP